MPNLASAQAQELRRVRLSFDGPVQQLDATGPADALNPANWAFSAQAPGPGAEVHASSVESVSASAVDVVSDVEFSPGIAYLATAVAIQNVSSPNNRAIFQAVVPSSPAGRRFAVAKLVPAMNIREDDTADLRKFLAVVQEPLLLLLNDVDHFTDIFDPDAAPEGFIDLMLADLGNPFTFEDLSLVDKRRLIQVLLGIYRDKGTARGIKNAIRFFIGYEVEITASRGGGMVLGVSLLGIDWVLGGAAGGPYDFSLKVGGALTSAVEKQIRSIIDFMKPSHTHLINLVSTLGAPKNLQAVGGPGQITLSWNAVTGATSYRLYWKTTAGVTTSNGALIGPVTSPYVHQPISAGQTRYYIVVAVSGAQEGFMSAETHATAT